MRISCFSAAVLIGGFEGLAISGYLHILIMVRGFLRSRGRNYNNDTGDHVPQVLSQPWA
ncbi:MAG: hypothetical protein WCC90_00445 [Methylocella sp.]